MTKIENSNDKISQKSFKFIRLHWALRPDNFKSFEFQYLWRQLQDSSKETFSKIFITTISFALDINLNELFCDRSILGLSFSSKIMSENKNSIVFLSRIQDHMFYECHFYNVKILYILFKKCKWVEEGPGVKFMGICSVDAIVWLDL